MQLSDLTPHQLRLVMEHARKKVAFEKRERETKILKMYPDEGQYRRELYKKHLDFFGAKARQSLFTAGNRCGKTIAGSYMTALHLTGMYPDWWDGKVFDGAVNGCCAGDTNESTRDIIQKELFGEVEGTRNGKRWVSGTGMIPLEAIKEIYWKSGVQNMIDYAIIQHVGGGLSKVSLKTYAQGRKLFQGTAYHFVWFDEEPPADVYSEALTRTATTGGIAYLTFTPLQGVSETIMLFLPEGVISEYNDGIRAVVNMTWDDVPHLDERTKHELLMSYPPYLRDARTKGVPMLGAGAVFPVPEENILVDDFEIPIYWPRAFGMDVGWNWNACVWGARNPDTDVLYIYSELKLSHVEPETFSAAVKGRGKWMIGAIDPASQGSNQFDGRKLIQKYRELDLQLIEADNAVEAGIHEMLTDMYTGKMKVFRSCTELMKEFRVYQRIAEGPKLGKIKKENDHGIDAWRYLRQTWNKIATVNPDAYRDPFGRNHKPKNVYTEFDVLD